MNGTMDPYGKLYTLEQKALLGSLRANPKRMAKPELSASMRHQKLACQSEVAYELWL